MPQINMSQIMSSARSDFMDYSSILDLYTLRFLDDLGARF